MLEILLFFQNLGVGVVVGKREIIAGLDIGTTKICLIIGEMDKDGKIDIIGVGTSPSHGLKRGIVVDLENTVSSIEQARRKAEAMAGFKIDSVYVGIAGGHISSLNNRGAVNVIGENKEVSAEDVNRVLEAAKAISIASDREIIHILTREFIVDGYDEIKEPIGMSGLRLEVEAHIITGASTAIENVAKSVRKAGLKINEIVLQPVASAEAVLTPAEKELGVILVDIGGGTTDIAIFNRGKIWHTAVLPIGGNHVTTDIAIGLRTSLPRAEKLKIRYGQALSYFVDPREVIEVTSTSEEETRTVERSFLSEIIEARIQEIFSLVIMEIKRSGYRDYLSGGIVITGGSSLMPGLSELVTKRLGLPVRIGTPAGIKGTVEDLDHPTYATAVGLVGYGSKYGSILEVPPEEDEIPILDNVWQVIKNWFKDFF